MLKGGKNVCQPLHWELSSTANLQPAMEDDSGGGGGGGGAVAVAPFMGALKRGCICNYISQQLQS